MPLSLNKPSTIFSNSPLTADPGFYSNAASAQGQQRTVITSGHVGQRKDGSWPETFREQVQQALSNLVASLESGGASARDIVKLTFYPVNWSIDMLEDLFKPVFQVLTEKHGVMHRPLTTLVPVPSLAFPQAKFEIEAVAMVGGAARPWRDADTPVYRPPPVETDVVVVGGGFSGLAAAHRCHEAGLKTIVLEAKSRIGGRSRTHKKQSGRGVVELGATWINKTTQPEVFALTQKFGLETLEQFAEGDMVYQGVDGMVIRGQADDLARSVSAEDRHQTAIYTQALVQRPDSIDIRKFHDFPKSEDVTFADWVAQLGCTGEHVQALANHFSSALIGRGSKDIGAHYFLDYIKSGLGFSSLVTDDKMGAQNLRVKNGTSEIAYSLARTLEPRSILLDCPVDSIVQHQGNCLVTTRSGASFRARKVIVAIPTNTYTDIHFTPPLPAGKRALVTRTMPGYYTKALVSYQEPWWRHAGLSGKFSSLKGPIYFSWDTSDPGSQQYSLALFIVGPNAHQWSKLSALQQEESLLKHLAELVGPKLAQKAHDVLEVNIMEWEKEEFLCGAPTSSMPPGLLSRFGDDLRTPLSNVHFAGAETAFEWKGYLEGAVRAGYRAAKEVTQGLQPVAKL
ncbi:hypothetical protein AJ78_07491 [Emergomyces pasteurianus Ep9510]|uniref:Amine oxidase n=1 Tax=Emergomyces pasteurianus Ep9510 TaxID=1447872 RepID=A0A1J9P525_9EURO|nr:hypothetical protein AJ78_07491 [Emergomyces pasteurianus Ep9510]